MQNAKDTFYITLRNRLTQVNPERTMLLRSVTRPGILVEEAESPMALPVLDAFTLRWTGLTVLPQLPLPLAQMSCEIYYSTAGTQLNSGLDRGRLLEAMDAELQQMLSPQSAPKMNYTTTPATGMLTSIFWSEPEFQPAVSVRDQISRVALLTVWSWQEAGER
ncbi:MULTISPECIES: hypothetical protein [Acidobacterium]|uniref:Uncharacterized protein n=1 Tax=Acidobacterium capsulatum (strain ATCC 51196 / DSM 11244 / BCRC 80197 / JCM 7670 / NBRC 15755 / NCIMB 13165 / 161) TaxID=240015 RepID=C1FAG1_ACIC5|nr:MULTISPECIES: hypothetical protein [Acidobacterium]ACO33894.1 hypothetical protein ACP_2360 [Acidobacterium capsulatum ATCC 51196]HCT62395.1 hypothetical protein [Acidobacterium sp.]